MENSRITETTSKTTEQTAAAVKTAEQNRNILRQRVRGKGTEEQQQQETVEEQRPAGEERKESSEKEEEEERRQKIEQLKIESESKVS